MTVRETIVSANAVGHPAGLSAYSIQTPESWPLVPVTASAAKQFEALEGAYSAFDEALRGKLATANQYSHFEVVRRRSDAMMPMTLLAALGGLVAGVATGPEWAPFVYAGVAAALTNGAFRLVHGVQNRRAEQGFAAAAAEVDGVLRGELGKQDLTAPMIAGVAAAASTWIAHSHNSHPSYNQNACYLSTENLAALKDLGWRLAELDPQAADRMERWNKLATLLRGHADVAAVMTQLHELSPSDQRELAPLILERMFVGEKPRVSTRFDTARDAYAELCSLSGRVTEPLPEAQAVDRTNVYRAFGQVVMSLEVALARACDSKHKTLEMARETVVPRERAAGDWNYEREVRQVSNQVLSIASLGDALAQALDPQATALERAGVAIVAEKCLRLLDDAYILGADARAALTTLVARAGDVEPEVRKQAARLYETLDNFNLIGDSLRSHYRDGTHEETHLRALRLLHENARPEELTGIAGAVLKSLYGNDPRSKGASTAEVELYTRLRAIAESAS